MILMNKLLEFTTVPPQWVLCCASTFHRLVQCDRRLVGTLLYLRRMCTIVHTRMAALPPQDKITSVQAQRTVLSNPKQALSHPRQFWVKLHLIRLVFQWHLTIKSDISGQARTAVCSSYLPHESLTSSNRNWPYVAPFVGCTGFL